jgi:small subunit ribosomal protein S21
MPKHYLRNPARKLVNCEQSESIDNALRRFKREVQTEDIITEVKPYSFYLKPDAKRRVNQALLGAKACSNEDSQGVVVDQRPISRTIGQTEIPCYGAVRPWI